MQNLYKINKCEVKLFTNFFKIPRRYHEVRRNQVLVVFVSFTVYMLSVIQARTTAVSRTLLQLSFKYDQTAITTLVPLLQNPFLLDSVAAKPLRLQKLLGMSTYSVEDALIQCYGVEWVGEAGYARLVGPGGDVILSTPDDCLGTVLATLSQRCQTRYPPCSGLDCYTASGFGWSLDLDALDAFTNLGKIHIEKTKEYKLDQDQTILRSLQI